MTAAARRTLDALVDIRHGTFSPLIYTDPELYQLELERVFARCWLYVGHESQIRATGDWIAACMGEDPVLVVRQPDASIRVFLNQCPHRGMRIAQADCGQARVFSCPYHGWTFNLAGDLVGVPRQQEGFGGRLNQAEWGTSVARVETYKGLIFATWDAEAPPLRDYLGDMAWYLDGVIDRVPGGTELVGGVHKWVIEVNWKIPAEQFAGDYYHTAVTHSSALDVFSEDRPEFDPVAQGLGAKPGFQYVHPNGHGVGFSVADGPTAHVFMEPLVAQWYKDTFDTAAQRLGRLRASRLTGANNIFPNFSFLAGTNTIRVWHPRGPDRMEVWAWTLVDAAAPPEVKDAFRISTMRSFSPGGLLEQDDAENWVEVQRVMRGAIARRGRFNLQLGLHHERITRDDAPGKVTGMFSDGAARAMYQRWVELLQSESWAEAEALKQARLSAGEAA